MLGLVPPSLEAKTVQTVPNTVQANDAKPMLIKEIK